MKEENIKIKAKEVIKMYKRKFVQFKKMFIWQMWGNSTTKELTKRQDGRHNILVNESDDIILATDEEKIVWKNCMKQLFNDQRNNAVNEFIYSETQPEVTRKGVKHD